MLGGGTKVGPKAELSRCVTQAGFEVDAGGVFSPCVPWCGLLTIMIRRLARRQLPEREA